MDHYKIKKYIRRKNRIHKKAKKTNTIGQWEKFRKIRNKCNKLILNAKQSYFDKISEKINTETNGSKNWWKLVKSLLHSDSGGDRSIPPLQVENDMIQDDNKKAELFNDYFCKQADLNDSETSVPDITDILINGLEQITVTENEVEDILKILDTSKAIGPDLLNPRLLKEAASILKYPLCTLFNLSLTLSTFPSEWKYANVTPVFKKDCPSNLKNYRPISLISILAKVMERLVYKHIYNYLIDNNLITSHQSGFTPGDSAVNQLLYITNEFGRALDEGKEVRVVFCDISKAFDRVWHKGLLRKLESIGIRGSLLSWVKNYLSERKQRVVINNSTSSWRDINAGVPQGSILENIKSSRSVQIIKSNLQPQNNTKPIYYYIGTRLGQILHARLRMQCSSLNHHLFRKNIVNSPFCQCGATETTAHFLLHCPRHNATRLRYIHTINLPINLNTDLLLFGSTDLTNTLNTDIFLNVQKFIISSKRFTS